jgi:hypothetical protein
MHPITRSFFLLTGAVCYELVATSGRILKLGENSKDARTKADLKFRTAERQATAQRRAMAEYEAESERRRIKSSKLKELRLAKEAEEAVERTAKGALPKKTKSAPKTPKK